MKGKGLFLEIELELIKINNESKVVDKCEWKDLKKLNTDFRETPFMKYIKDYILKSIEYIIQNYISSSNFEINLIDIQVLLVDTLPSHILASAIIGFFDLLGESLNEFHINQIDDFIAENEGFDFPNYEKLILGILNTNK